MVTLDMPCFVKMLCSTKENTNNFSENMEIDSVALEYLLHDLVVPLLMECDIPLDDIDYSAFELDDLRHIAEFLYQHEDSVFSIISIVENLSSLKAKVAVHRAFC